MHIQKTAVLCLCPCLYFAAVAQAQTTQNPISVPRIIRYSGHIDTPQPRTTGATFSLYREEHGGTALWSEIQNVQLDKDGNYTSLLGSGHPEGMPVDIFNTTEPRWLEVEVDQVKLPRVLVSSVPYALRAADADTLGGLPASAYLRADPASTSKSVVALSGSTPAALAPNAISGSQGFLPVFTDSNNDLGNSAIFQPTSTQVAIGGQTPLGALTLIGNFPFSDAPGMALFNQGGGGGASVSLDMYNTSFNGGIPQAKIKAIDDGNYSDHLTFLLKNPGGPGNAVVERLRITSSGRVGIGTTSPAQMLDVIGVGRFTGGIMFSDGSTQTTAATGGGGGGGSITGVTANSPITGGGTSGNVTIGLTNCTAGQILIASGAGWSCGAQAGGGGSSQWTTTGNNIFYNTGNVGIGTGTPAVPLDVQVSASMDPAIRAIGTNKNLSVAIAAQQTGGSSVEIAVAGGSGQFAATANTGDAVIRTTGASSPANLLLGISSSEAMRIATNGNVGIGTTSPSTLLQVGNGGATGKIQINSQDSNGGLLQLGNPNSNSEASIAMISGVSSFSPLTSVNGLDHGWVIGPGAGGLAGNVFSIFNLSKGFSITINADGSLSSATGASLSSGGVWTNKSDRNSKENFRPVVTTDILHKIDALPLTEWNYKNEDPSVRHIGPVAQDFYSIFGVGNSDTSISTIDPAGIALAGIQALDAKAADLEKQLAAKTDEVRSLQERLARLEAMMQQPAAQPAQ